MIQPPTEVEPGVKLVIYGRGKTGKTRLVASFPKPLLLIGTEDGTKSIKNGKVKKKSLKSGIPVYTLLLGGKPTGVDFVQVYRTEQLDEIVEEIKSAYKSGGLDHGGGLQDLVIKEVLGLDEIPVQRSWGMAQQKDWGVIGAQTKERLRRLIDLADKYGTHIAITAHERNFNEDNNSDVMVASVGAALTPTAATWLNGACDYICQTFIREQTKKVSTSIGVGKDAVAMETEEKTGKKEYCLRVGPHPVYMTGFRLPPGVELPDVIIDPTFAKIDALIHGS